MLYISSHAWAMVQNNKAHYKQYTIHTEKNKTFCATHGIQQNNKTLFDRKNNKKKNIEKIYYRSGTSAYKMIDSYVFYRIFLFSSKLKCQFLSARSRAKAENRENHNFHVSSRSTT